MVEARRDLLVVSAFMVHFPHALRQVLHFTLHVMNATEYGKAFSKHGASGQRETILGQIPTADVTLAVDGTVIKAFNGCQDFQQSGFPCTISADQSDFSLGVMSQSRS